MSTIYVNGEPRPCAAGATCRDLVAEVTGRQVGDNGRAASGGALGVALAVGGRVVPRSEWATTALADGDRLDLVTATQGG